MKNLLISFFLIGSIYSLNSQTMENLKTTQTMKLNAGIITDNLNETKSFYKDILGFGITFENDFYLLMHTPDRSAEISFLLPNHPSQQPLFHTPFSGAGIYLTIEVENVDALYDEIKEKGVDIEIELRDEPWGDRHFAIQDPNGVGIDFVKYTAREEQPVDEEKSSNKVSWFSIPAEDTERATTFYNKAFGWKVLPEIEEDDEIYSYNILVNSDSDDDLLPFKRGSINGCIVKKEIGLPTPAILVEVDNLDTAVEKVVRAGGEILTDRVLMKSLNGHFILIKDTEGNYVEVFQSF